jgi:hypothetical protein
MTGKGAPSNVRSSDGVSAPTLMGCVWMVPRHGASDLARSEGSISPLGVAPMS